MKLVDIQPIADVFSFPWTTRGETVDKWTKYYLEDQKNIRAVALMEIDNNIIGYGTLLRQSEYPNFSNFPEISDVWIDASHRRCGLGKQLILWLEDLARQEGYKQVGLGVGLYKDYGPAQILYSHLGYTPDGQGITYDFQPIVPGKKYPIDDDLILWLTKSL